MLLKKLDAALDLWTQRHSCWAVALYELVCFDIKQAHACLFGDCTVVLLLFAWTFYPRRA
ncbi:MAG: hypothetical protein LBU72_00440 [Burkholderiaceae bacterium]|jgi:uncharacterized membrane protein YoaT (DUF817 family)|nr:hypothetical protein [Burkholderiaceae bacterium]